MTSASVSITIQPFDQNTLKLFAALNLGIFHLARIDTSLVERRTEPAEALPAHLDTPTIRQAFDERAVSRRCRELAERCPRGNDCLPNFKAALLKLSFPCDKPPIVAHKIIGIHSPIAGLLQNRTGMEEQPEVPK